MLNYNDQLLCVRTELENLEMGFFFGKSMDVSRFQRFKSLKPIHFLEQHGNC